LGDEWVAQMLAPVTALLRAEVDFAAVQEEPEPDIQVVDRYVAAMETTGRDFFTNRPVVAWWFFQRFYALDLSRHEGMAARQPALRTATAALEAVAVAQEKVAPPPGAVPGRHVAGPYWLLNVSSTPARLDPDREIAAELEILDRLGPLAERLKGTGKEWPMAGLS